MTDIGSTKANLVRGIAAEDRGRFVGGHPVCGSEARGPGSARAEIFDGATWFLTPVAETDPARYAGLVGALTAIGARPVAIAPGAHDRLVALTSHLPHVLANLLATQAAAGTIDGHDPLAAVGGSFRDMTRVAGANARIWVDIFIDNREALLAALAEHRRRLDDVTTALEAGDSGQLARWIGESAAARRRRDRAAYPEADGDLHTVRVHLADRPGSDRRHHAGPRRGARLDPRPAAAPPLDRGRRLPRDRRRRRGRRGRGRRHPRRAGLRGDRRGGGPRGMSAVLNDHWDVEPAAGLRGELPVNGDKSVSHRSLLLGAVNDGPVEVRGFGWSEDTRATLEAVRALGVQVDEGPRGELTVHGAGLRGLREPDGVIDVRNSGTLLRLLPGLLAGQPAGRFTVDGDASIRRRPVGRIADPLREMGADVEAANGLPPLLVRAGPAADRHRVRAAGRVGAGEELPAARGAAGRGADDRHRAARQPRPHGADAAGRPACASSAARAA